MATSYQVTRFTGAPIEQVWALLADVSAQARWNESLASIEGHIAEGGIVALVSRLDPKRTFRLKVSDVSPPRRMVWSDGMPFGLFRGVLTLELEDRGGQTAFSMREEYGGPLAGHIARSIPDMTESFDHDAHRSSEPPRPRRTEALDRPTMVGTCRTDRSRSGCAGDRRS